MSNSKKNKTDQHPDSDTAQTNNSRRDFLRKSAAGVGAAVAAGAGAQVFAAGTADIGKVKLPSIRIPTDFTDSLAQDAKPGKFEGRGMSGAEVFAQLCKKEKLAGLFCCPGNYTVINALAAAGIPSYGGRSEGARKTVTSSVSGRPPAGPFTAADFHLDARPGRKVRQEISARSRPHK